MNKIEAMKELTSKTVGFCICGEKVCFKDCRVCDILLTDKLEGKQNKTYKLVQPNDRISKL
jgi:hypothetical protein